MADAREIPFAPTVKVQTHDGVMPITKELVDAILQMHGAGGDVEAADRKKHQFMDTVTKRRSDILKWIREGKTKRFIHLELGVSRSEIDKYINSDEELLEAWHDAMEDKLDFHEENVCSIAEISSEMEMTEAGAFPRNDGRIMAASLNASKLWLEHMGRARGWTPKIETCETGAGGRIPIILCGQMSEESIIEAEAQIKEANADIEAKLLAMGVNKG